MKTHVLTGLDAQNPLGFLAALGLLRILDLHAVANGATRPTLGYSNGDTCAVLTCSGSLDDVIGVVLEDAAAQKTAAFLQIAYDATGALVSPEHPDAKRDLKPSPAAARTILERVAASGSRRDQDLLSGLFSELVTDNNGNTKPTALHFTAGKQVFLPMVEELRTGVTAMDLDEALRGPWLNTSSLPSLSWDASVTRQYALRASDPSTDKKSSVAGANWLAVHALAFFPVQVARDRLVTTAVRGGWKDSVFTWPVWSPGLRCASIASLLRALDPNPESERRWSAKERAAMGIDAVFSSKILRSDQGGYGSFTPAAVVLPR